MVLLVISNIMLPKICADGDSLINPLQELPHRIFDLKRTERKANYEQIDGCTTLLVPKCHYSFQEVCTTHYKEYCEIDPTDKTCRTQIETICDKPNRSKCIDSIDITPKTSNEKSCYRKYKKVCKLKLRGKYRRSGKYSCKNVPMKICKVQRKSYDVSKIRNCGNFKNKRCHQIPKTRCKEAILRNKCNTIPVKECHQVPKQVCFHYKKICCKHNCGHSVQS